MKVVSNHRSHAELIARNGSTIVNGLIFRAGNDGRPTAEGVQERQVETFLGVEGFSFYHDDGVYSGTSLKTPSLIEQGSAALSNAGSQARAHTIIEKMLADGELTPEVLAALLERAPVIQVNTTASTLTLTGSPLVPDDAPEAEQAEASTETVPEITAEASQTDEPTSDLSAEDADTDLTDVDALLKLPRPEFLGLASRYRVRTVAQSNPVVAQGIVDAVLAERGAQTETQN